MHDADDTAVSYYEPNGIEAFLKRLAPYYDESKEYWENGHLVGLAREGVAVSLEPGGQVEASIGVLHEPGDLNGLYADFRCEADPILEELASVSSTTDTSRSRVSSTCRSIRKAAMTR